MCQRFVRTYGARGLRGKRLGIAIGWFSGETDVVDSALDINPVAAWAEASAG